MPWNSQANDRSPTLPCRERRLHIYHSTKGCGAYAAKTGAGEGRPTATRFYEGGRT